MTEQALDLEMQLIIKDRQPQDPPDCDLVFVFKIDEKLKEETFQLLEIMQLKSDVFKSNIALLALGSLLDKEQEQSKWDVIQQLKDDFYNILKTKCNLDVEKHITDEHIFFKVTAKEEILEEEADRISYKLRMKKDVDRKGLAKDCPPYAKVDSQFYNAKNKKLLFQVYESRGIHFRQVDRARLITSIVGKYVVIPQAAKHDLFQSFVPKDSEIENNLSQKMLTWNPFQQYPIEDIRNYFGEQVALYFCFVDHFFQ